MYDFTVISQIEHCSSREDPEQLFISDFKHTLNIYPLIWPKNFSGPEFK